MPHIDIKCYPGRTEEQKRRLSEKIARDMVEIFECPEESISIAITDVLPENWESQVKSKEIDPKLDLLYKKPGEKI